MHCLPRMDEDLVPVSPGQPLQLREKMRVVRSLMRDQRHAGEKRGGPVADIEEFLGEVEIVPVRRERTGLGLIGQADEIAADFIDAHCVAFYELDRCIPWVGHS